ncbi:DNA-binding transcriptional LysR family regulator [Sinobacterium caligoides]|uniref:DNA-binding transcriptional LysR family regulator n=1 Tax=Sinobacterium caligoides TaxID=933926 RepID=A0A3N2DNR6_9GAMM|nr:LysR family transcriptional regulator [Sinobacterium caligoides]ROS01458.1 DNA-binding transcriptional LysR family regulator [Sinobacterium caligoides]
MDLRKLQIFLVVAEQLSFSAAAKQLHMAQPAVSIAIRKLEEELGTLLLERAHRGIRLTEEGLVTQARARDILQQVKELNHCVGEMANLLRGEVRIACPSMVATYLLPELLGDFLLTHTGLTASVTQNGTQHIEQMLLDDQIELGVVTITDGQEGLETQPLIEQEVQLCVALDHPLAKHQVIELPQLSNLAMVIYESDYYIRKLLDAACATHKVSPDIRLQTNFLPLIKGMVKRGIGVTVGLNMMAEQEDSLAGIPFQPPIHIQMAIAKRRGRVISRANQALLDWLAHAPHVAP